VSCIHLCSSFWYTIVYNRTMAPKRWLCLAPRFVKRQSVSRRRRYVHTLFVYRIGLLKWKYIHTLIGPASTIVYMNVVNNCVPHSVVCTHLSWWQGADEGVQQAIKQVEVYKKKEAAFAKRVCTHLFEKRVCNIMYIMFVHNDVPYLRNLPVLDRRSRRQRYSLLLWLLCMSCRITQFCISCTTSTGFSGDRAFPKET
jgi:hypothetical protein